CRPPELTARWATTAPSASRVTPAEISNAGPLPATVAPTAWARTVSPTRSATVAAHHARVTARYRSHGRPSWTATVTVAPRAAPNPAAAATPTASRPRSCDR